MEYIFGALVLVLVCFGGCKLLESTMTPTQLESVEQGIRDGTNYVGEGIDKGRHWVNGAFDGPKKAAEDFRKKNTFSNWLKSNGG